MAITETPTENGYVEQHQGGCNVCSCSDAWSAAEIKRVRRREGLPADWRN